MEWVNPPQLPSLNLPEAFVLPIPILEVPQADVPSYKPLVVPPNTLRPPPGIEGVNSDPAPKAKTKTPPLSMRLAKCEIYRCALFLLVLC